MPPAPCHTRTRPPKPTTHPYRRTTRRRTHCPSPPPSDVPRVHPTASAHPAPNWQTPRRSPPTARPPPAPPLPRPTAATRPRTTKAHAALRPPSSPDHSAASAPSWRHLLPPHRPYEPPQSRPTSTSPFLTTTLFIRALIALTEGLAATSAALSTAGCGSTTRLRLRRGNPL